MNSVTPAVSVLLPAYNQAAHLAESLDSILAQTFSDFELIAIDDASTDATPAILETYARRDSRVRILTNTVNQTIAASLNRGLAESRATIIARMDGDDWAYPQRFAKQYSFMIANPHVAVCGTGIETYESGKIYAWAGLGEEVRIRLLFGCCVYHPTVMARREALLASGGYALNMPCAEDYDLWLRMADHGYALACLPDVLLRYRMHPTAVRTPYKWQMRETTERIHRRQLAALGLSPSPMEYDRHLYCISPCPETPGALRKAEIWLQTIQKANDRHATYDQASLSKVLNTFRREFRVLSHKAFSRYCRRQVRHIVKRLLAFLPGRRKAGFWI